ncbi:MAG: hypothetical protein CK425_06455 [Parachlamydia sp.]|nr:MAG: hypothetical protein CK425_06455 [Parachlamydia sp.]
MRKEREDAAKQLAMLEKLSFLKKRQSQGYDEIQNIIGKIGNVAEDVKSLNEEQAVFAAKLVSKTKGELVEEARKLDEEERKFAVEKEKFEWEEVLFIARECVLKRLKIDNLQTKNWEVSLLTLENPTELLKKNKLVWENILEFIVNQEKSNKADLKKMIALVVYLTNHEEMDALLQILEKKISQIFPTTSESQPALPKFGKKPIFSPREEIYCSALEAAATCNNLIVFEQYFKKIPMLSPGLLTTLWKRVVINDSLGVAEYLLTHYKEASETLCLLDNPKAKFAVVEKIVEEIPTQLAKVNFSGCNSLGNALNKKNSAFVNWILYSTHPQVEAQRKSLLAYGGKILEVAGHSDPQSFYMVMAACQKFQLESDEKLKEVLDLYISSNSLLYARAILETAFSFINDSDPLVLIWVIGSIKRLQPKINLTDELQEFINSYPTSKVEDIFGIALSLVSTTPKILSLVKEAAQNVKLSEDLSNRLELEQLIEKFLVNEVVQKMHFTLEGEKDEGEDAGEDVFRILTPKFLYIKSPAEAEEDYKKAIQENNFDLAQSIILKFSEKAFWRENIKELSEYDDTEVALIKLKYQMNKAKSQEK